MEYVYTRDIKALKELEFTMDGYVVCNGLYIGLTADNDWNWYGSIDLARLNLNPIINFKAINEVKDFIDNY